MKRWLKLVRVYIILSCLLVSQVSMAETKPELRHVHDFQGIGLSVGSTLEAPCVGLEYTYHLARSWHLNFGLGYSADQQVSIAMHQLGLQTLLAYTLWSHRSNYYTNLLAGCNLAYRWQENIRKRQQQTYFAIGALLGCGLELYLTNHCVLSLMLTPQVHILNANALGLFELLGMLGLQYAY